MPRIPYVNAEETGWFYKDCRQWKAITFKTLTEARKGAMKYYLDWYGDEDGYSVVLSNHENRRKVVGRVMRIEGKWVYRSSVSHRWYDLRSDGRITR